MLCSKLVVDTTLGTRDEPSRRRYSMLATSILLQGANLLKSSDSYAKRVSTPRSIPFLVLVHCPLFVVMSSLLSVLQPSTLHPPTHSVLLFARCAMFLLLFFFQCHVHRHAFYDHPTIPLLLPHRCYRVARRPTHVHIFLI